MSLPSSPLLLAGALTAAAMLGPLGAPAQAQGFGIDHAAEYSACMTLASTTPEEAFESAIAWRDLGGGNPAQHCVAVALIGLGNYEEGAKRLEELASGLDSQYQPLRGNTLAQAAQAWMLAGDLERANAVQTIALKEDPDNLELLLDRSLTLGAAGSYWEAIDDLNRANEVAPDRADVLVYRASAYRFVEAFDLALDDLAQALVLAPGHPEALLERGNLHRLRGDLEAARRDWHQVTLIAEGTPTADAAQANIEKLELTTP